MTGSYILLNKFSECLQKFSCVHAVSSSAREREGDTILVIGKLVKDTGKNNLNCILLTVQYIFISGIKPLTLIVTYYPRFST